MKPKSLRETEKANNSERLINDLEQTITKKTEELDSRVKTRDKLIKRLQAKVANNEEKDEENHDSNVISDAYDTTEEGEVEPSEDELTNVQYSETKTIESTPIPGPSKPRAAQTKVPGTPTKSRPREDKPIKKKISPIKYPEAAERKQHEEDVPLSRLTTPKRSKPVARQDLRKKLDMVSVFTEPKLHSDKGPLESRLSCHLPGPWITGCGPKCGTEHRNRPFIAGNTLSSHGENSSNNWSNREASDMEEEEEEGEKVSEDDISTDEIEEESNCPRRNQKK